MKVRLDEIIEKTFAGEWGSDDVDNNGIPVLRTTNFTNDGTVNYSDVVTRKITKENINHKFLKKGDILIEKSGGSNKQPVGRVVYFVGEENKFLFNNFTGLIRVKNYDKWSSEYIFYSLFVNYLNGSTKKFENKTTGLHNLKLDSYLKSVEITERSLKEQQAIVNVLNHLNKIIQKRKKQLKKLDELVKSRFIEMFGDPVTNSKMWEIDCLGNITTKIGSGMTPRGGKESYLATGVALIRSMNVHDGKFEYKDLAYISAKQASEMKNVELIENDVLFNITGASVTRTCVVPNTILPARVNQHVAIIRCINESLNPIFLNNLFLQDGFKYKLLNLARAGGATREAITKQQLEDLNVILPPIEIQNQFADFVEQTDKSKFVIQKLLNYLL
ncbi:putative uncharacterized protein [Phascolarctobacterium sp. CAG:266]|nr:putative uncharacterized protein [Phascolarctobacterium sp. CAG:266]